MLGAAVLGFCGLLVFNFTRLAEAETVVNQFVRDAVAEGSGMHLPALAPSTDPALTPDKLDAMLTRAHQIGPMIAIHSTSCAVETDAGLCGGQTFACAVRGLGHGGASEADVLLCRSGDLQPYKLAGSHWIFHFTNGEPIAADKLPI